jgi:hypothetical protein
MSWKQKSNTSSYSELTTDEQKHANKNKQVAVVNNYIHSRRTKIIGAEEI